MIAAAMLLLGSAAACDKDSGAEKAGTSGTEAKAGTEAMTEEKKDESSAGQSAEKAEGKSQEGEDKETAKEESP